MFFRKVTDVGTCPCCGGGKIKSGWRLRMNGRCLICVDCGAGMKPRKRRRAFLWIGF